MPVPLGAPVFSPPVIGEDAGTDQDTWGARTAVQHQQSQHQQSQHQQSQHQQPQDQDQESWGDESWGDESWDQEASQRTRIDYDRWGDDRPPIWERPAGLVPPAASARRQPPGDTLLFDGPEPDHRAPGPARGGRGGRGRRSATIVVPIIVLVVVAVLALALLTGHGLKFGPLTANQNNNQNSGPQQLPMAAINLATYPGQQDRGVFQTINRVVASGHTIVTMGSQTSGGLVRQQFFVSGNGGANWHTAPVRAPDGGQPALGHPAALLAGGQGGWVAVGPQAIWTSRDGLSWTLAATHGISPQLPGDSVWVVTKTAGGFLAAGTRTSHGTSQAVLWTSRDGVTWQRTTAARLNMAQPGETVLNISYATFRGTSTVISGTVAKGGTSYDVSWLSTNDGATWTRVTIPVDHGAATSISGLAFDGSGFIAVRPSRTVSGAATGIAYFSPNGLAWQYAGTIDATGGWSPSVVKGSDYGFVVTGASASGQLVAYTSTGTGTFWQPTGSLGNASTESVSGATVAQAGTIVAVGSSAKAQVSQQPVFLETNTAGTVRAVSLASIPGAIIPELTVNGIAVADGSQIAVGSANGYPAIWRKPLSGGAWTLVSSLTLVAADPALRSLTGVTHGSAGWLAVGAPGPVVLTSTDGVTWGVAGGNITRDLVGVSAVAVASGPAGYAIVGKLVAPGGGCIADVWWSPNLLIWTRAHDVNLATGSSQVLAVAASANGFVSVGSHNGKPAAWTTSDGPSWRTIELPAPAGASTAALQQVAINGNHVVALGQVTNASGAAIGQPFAEFSADGGAHWQQVPFSSPGPGTVFTALTADSGGFTAAGLFDQGSQQNVAVWTSATGASWKPSQASGLLGAESWQIDALAPSGSAVTGIGSVVTQQSQQTVTFNLPSR